MKKILLFLFINCLSYTLFSESLWNDNATYIYSQKINYKAGDTVEIVVEETSVIDYKSTNKTDKFSNITITGGEMTTLLTFLPKGNIEESKNSQNKDQFKINTVLQGTITNINNQIVTISASKNVQIDNKSSKVQITGEANISDISGKKISSKKLLNSQISITTLIDNDNIVINQNDFEKFRINPDSTTDLREDTRIRDEKKREMLLNYFNKILNVIF